MSLNEALEEIRGCNKFNARTFSIEFLTYDAKRKTGGKIKVFDRCKGAGSSNNERLNGTVSIQSSDHAHPIAVHIHLIQKLNGNFIGE